MKMTTYRMANIGMIAAFGVFGLVACNSDDYKTSEASRASDSTAYSTDAAAAGNTADGNTIKDATKKEAVTAKDATTAEIPNSAASSNASATTTKTGAKKRTAKIMWNADNSDAIAMDKEGVYNKAQVMPEFPGGQAALSDYVNNHLDYPQEAIDQNTTGIVRVAFVVNEDGKVTKAHLLDKNGKERVGSGLDEQALRVVNTMPKWKPGKVNGKAVKTRLELPINFQLEA